MAETSSLLNCRAGYRTGGSNPPASASVLKHAARELHKKAKWWIHLMVRIQDSQSWHRGSIPLSTTLHRTNKRKLLMSFLFLLYHIVNITTTFHTWHPLAKHIYHLSFSAAPHLSFSGACSALIAHSSIVRVSTLKCMPAFTTCLPSVW